VAKSKQYLVVDAANQYDVVPGSPFPSKKAAQSAVDQREQHDGRVGEDRHDYKIVEVD
jgi:hypothetical protein